MQPLISIIIPVYNVESYLRQCLDSILIDNASEMMQVICVNDGSSDGSPSILKEYANNYSNLYIINQPNAGLSNARNTGLKNAIGKYIYFLDSDDYLFPGVLHKMCSFMERKALQIGCFNVLKEGRELYYPQTTLISEPMSGENFASLFRAQCHFSYVAPLWMYLYEREFLLTNKLFNKEGILHEDEDFTPRVLSITQRIALLNIPIQYHRIKRDGSITAHVSQKHLVDSWNTICSLVCYFKGKKDNSSIAAGVTDFWLITMQKIYDNNYTYADIGVHPRQLQKLLLICEDAFMIRLVKLSMRSLGLMIRYYRNQLPAILRKGINRWC